MKEYFGGLVNPAKEKPRTMSKVPARTVSKSVIATDKEATNYFVQVDYPAAPSKVETTLKDYRDYLVKIYLQVCSTNVLLN